MRKIVVTGPESTGKTSLTRALAAELREPWTAEYARTYLSEHGPAYEEFDLLAIAKGQIQAEHAIRKQASKWLLCDTSLEVLYIWSEFRYGRVDAWIWQQLLKETGDLYLLCRPDLPWEPDPLREHPNQRWELMDRYELLLQSLEASYGIVEGLGNQRLVKARALIDQKLIGR